MSVVSPATGPAITMPIAGSPSSSASSSSSSSSSSASASSGVSLSPAVLAADGAARAVHMAQKAPRGVPVRVPAILPMSVSWEKDIAPLERGLSSSLRAFRIAHKEAARIRLQLNKAKWYVTKEQWNEAKNEAQTGLDIQHPTYSDADVRHALSQAKVELALILAFAHNQLRNWEKAVQAVDLVKISELAPVRAKDLLVQKAFALCQEGELDDALATCDEAIALDPSVLHSKAYAIKAHLHNEKGEGDKAIAAAEAGNTVIPDDLTKADLANELARAYNAKGMRDEAIAAARGGLGLSEISDQIKAELYLQEARAHLGKGVLWDDVLQAADLGLQLHDVSDEVVVELCRVKAQAHNEKGEPDDALAAAKLGLTIDFAKQGTRLMLIHQHTKASFARNEMDDVIAVATNGLQMSVGSDQQKAELCLLKAKAHAANSEDDDVITTTAQGVALGRVSDQVKAELYLHKADAHYGKQEYDDMITAGTAGVALTGSSVQTRVSLNNLKLFAHIAKGEYDNAILAGQAGDALASGSDDGTKGALYHSWGLAHMKKGEWMLAVAAFQKGTAALNKKYAMRSLRADMHTLIAECYNRHPKKGKTTSGKDDAEAAAREALRLRPGNSAAQTELKIAQGSIRPDGYRESVLSEIGGVISRHNPCPCDDD